MLLWLIVQLVLITRGIGRGKLISVARGKCEIDARKVILIERRMCAIGLGKLIPIARGKCETDGGKWIAHWIWKRWKLNLKLNRDN